MNELDYRVAIEALENHVAQTRPIYETAKAIDYLKKAHQEALAKQEHHSCSHRIVDITNEAIKSGYMCMGCGALFGAYLQKEPKQEQRSDSEHTGEPVAWIEHEWAGTGLRKLHFERHEPTLRDEVVNPIWTPLYTTPQPKQEQSEPVAWMAEREGKYRAVDETDWGSFAVYTTPQQRKPLTIDQIWEIAKDLEDASWRQIVDAIEAAHGIKE